MEVYTYDRLGLLYEVTKSLFDLQLSIDIAKISPMPTRWWTFSTCATLWAKSCWMKIR